MPLSGTRTNQASSSMHMGDYAARRSLEVGQPTTVGRDCSSPSRRTSMWAGSQRTCSPMFLGCKSRVRRGSPEGVSNLHQTTQVRTNPGRRKVARGATSTRERRRERTSTGAASTTSSTSGPGSEDGVRAFRPPPNLMRVGKSP